MYKGYVKVLLQIAGGSVPVTDEKVYIKAESGTGILPVSPESYDFLVVTDSSGSTAPVAIETPAPAASQNEFSNEVPYALASVYVDIPGFFPVRINGVQVFPDNLSTLPINLTPITAGFTGENRGVITYDIPESTVLQNTPRSPEFPDENAAEATPAILDEVVIPETVRVHLGRPDAAAENVYLSFPDYVKNVASSEVYPTWTEETLRANILAIISLTLNRIYTEWYPSRGYDFDITSTTQFDQAFVPGRNIFDNISRIVDETFNEYITREGAVSPLFTSYCDGRRVNCDGLSQWGSQSLGEQGLSALNILKYYYGNNITLRSTDNIENLPSSYPGTPLSLGSTGEDVETIRRELYRISFNYPLIPRVNPLYDVFDSSLDAAVRTFQEVFGLAVDGIVGKATWYKISYVYTSIVKLAELVGSGEAGALPDEPPTVTVRIGDSGVDVARLQFLLAYIGTFYGGIDIPLLDGEFGTKTERALREFQQMFGLQNTGFADADDWAKLYEVYGEILRAVTPTLGETGYPGTPLQRGSRGEYVKLIQEYINRIARDYPALPTLTVDGVFGSATEDAVRLIQERFFLPTNGIVGAETWEQIAALYRFLENQAAS